MPTEKKVQVVDELAELMARSPVIITTNYRGLTMSQMSELRHKLRPLGAEYHVVKNTLVRLAGERIGRPAVGEILSGPTGMVFSSGEPSDLAKTLLTYAQSSGAPLVMVGALLDRRPVTGAEVVRLATLPSRDVLRSQVLGGLQSPLRRMVYVLSAQISGLTWVLQSRMKQLEQGG